MDSDVLTALTTMFTSWKDSTMDVIQAIIPIAAVVLITTGVVMFSISFFRKFMHH